MKTAKEIAFEFGICTCENPDEPFSLGIHDCGWHNHDVEEAMEKYADQFKPKWISLEDELPPSVEDVLNTKQYLVSDGKRIWVDIYWIDSKFNHLVTHWMDFDKFELP